MKKNHFRTILIASLCVAATINSNAQTKSPTMSHGLSVPMKGSFMGKPYELTTAPNGALVNKSLMTDYKVYQTPLTSNFVKKEIVKVADGIYSIQGIYVGTVPVIETKNGVILYDTGEKPEEAREILRLLETVTNKPVIAVIYSHSHYVYGMTAIKEKYPNVQIIAHPKLLNNVISSFGVGGVYPELSGLLIGNVLQQFHTLLPKEGQDAPFGAFIDVADPNGFLAPTRLVKDSEIIQIDGMDFQFFTEYDSDADDCLLVWIPQKKTVLNNLFWGVMPNIYSLRGSNYRETENWTAGLYKIRDLKPTYMLSVPATPVIGTEKCINTVETYADFFNLVKDQTLRAMLLGKAPQDLGKFIKLPEEMKEAEYLAETYGVLETFPEPIYQYARGWFDGDAANIFKLPRVTEAENFIKAVGGADRVLKLVDEAIKDDDQVWALKLVNYLYISDPTNQEYRTKKAQLLYQMGIVLESQNARSWCITQAYALTNTLNVPRLFMPRELLEKMTPQMLISQYRVRIDPEKSNKADFMLNFDIEGENTLGLHCRHGVVEFIPNVNVYERKADATLTLSRGSLNDMFLNTKSISDILSASGTSITGDKAKVEQFLSYFDEIFSPAMNQAIPVINK